MALSVTTVPVDAPAEAPARALRQLPLPVMVTDVHGFVTHASGALLDLVGRDDATAVGQAWEHVLHAAEEGRLAHVADAVASHGAWRGQVPVGPAAHQTLVNLEVAPLWHDDGGRLGLLVVARPADTTRAADADLARELDSVQALARRVGAAGLREAQQLADGLAGLAARFDAADGRRALVDGLVNTARHLRTILGELEPLLGSQSDGHDLWLDPTLDALWPGLEQHVGADVTLAREGKASHPIPDLTVDAFRRVLIELVDNASRAAGAGGHVAVAVVEETLADARTVNGATLAPGAWVVLQVEDDGPGLPAASVDIWSPFVSIREGTEGAGMGLATVKTIVEARGGACEASAIDTGGARFRCWWPTQRAEVSVAAAPELSAALTDVNELVWSAVWAVVDAYERQALRIRWHLAPDLPAVTVDEAHLRRSLRDLLRRLRSRLVSGSELLVETAPTDGGVMIDLRPSSPALGFGIGLTEQPAWHAVHRGVLAAGGSLRLDLADGPVVRLRLPAPERASRADADTEASEEVPIEMDWSAPASTRTGGSAAPAVGEAGADHTATFVASTGHRPHIVLQRSRRLTRRLDAAALEAAGYHVTEAASLSELDLTTVDAALLILEAPLEGPSVVPVLQLGTDVDAEDRTELVAAVSERVPIDDAAT